MYIIPIDEKKIILAIYVAQHKCAFKRALKKKVFVTLKRFNILNYFLLLVS